MSIFVPHISAVFGSPPKRVSQHSWVDGSGHVHHNILVNRFEGNSEDYFSLSRTIDGKREDFEFSDLNGGEWRPRPRGFLPFRFYQPREGLSDADILAAYVPFLRRDRARAPAAVAAAGVAGGSADAAGSFDKAAPVVTRAATRPAAGGAVSGGAGVAGGAGTGSGAARATRSWDPLQYLALAAYHNFEQ